VDQVSALALAVSVSLILSTLITDVMTEPLRAVLKNLCLDSDSTAFWIPFTTVMFYVTPLLSATLFASTVTVPDFGNTLRTALSSSLFGAFAALLVVGFQIARARPVVRKSDLPQ
jgi:hypothetical protein